MRTWPVVLTLMALSVCLVACPPGTKDSAISPEDSSPEGDSDVDADSDADSDADTDTEPPVDGDGDGYTEDDGDCDDADATVNPGASEVCDGVDNDCDGYVDEPTGSWSMACSGAKLVGETEYDNSGFAVSGAGDVNGDGFDDVIVGATAAADRSDVSTGAAYLVLGPVTGEVDLAAADATLYGENDSDRAGAAVATAGDVDGDGYTDVLVGALDDATGGTEAGAVYLVAGPISGPQSLASAEAKFFGEAGQDFAGRAISGDGDVNGDGINDALIGSWRHDITASDEGAAYLVLGGTTGDRSLAAADAKLTGEADSDYAGYSVSIVGDMNGDGFDDMLVGAWGEYSGSSGAYVVFGPVLGEQDLGNADAILTAEQDGDYAGVSPYAALELERPPRAGSLYTRDPACTARRSFVLLIPSGVASSYRSSAIRLRRL